MATEPPPCLSQPPLPPPSEAEGPENRAPDTGRRLCPGACLGLRKSPERPDITGPAAWGALLGSCSWGQGPPGLLRRGSCHLGPPAVCRKELTAEARELKGELYCLPCHDKMGVPICGACRRPIEGRVVNALGKQWHVEVSAAPATQAWLVTGTGRLGTDSGQAGVPASPPPPRDLLEDSQATRKPQGWWTGADRAGWAYSAVCVQELVYLLLSSGVCTRGTGGSNGPATQPGEEAFAPSALVCALSLKLRPFGGPAAGPAPNLLGSRRCPELPPPLPALRLCQVREAVPGPPALREEGPGLLRDPLQPGEGRGRGWAGP